MGMFIKVDMGIETILQGTAMSKKESKYLKDLDRLSSELKSLNDALIIGGLGTKLLSEFKYKCKMPEVTDIDIFYSKMPDELKEKVDKIPLTEKARRRASAMSITEENIPSKYFVYKCKSKVLGYDIDVFKGNIGPMKYSFPLITEEIKLDKNNIKIAPSMIITSQINPASYNQKRDDRIRCFMESYLNRDNHNQILKECVKIYKDSELAKTTSSP